MLNDAELSQLLHNMESERVERKASAAELKKISKAVCAFANDLPNHVAPGVVFVGVNDDGSCADLDITDELLVRLAQVRSSGNILPIPSITVRACGVNGCRVVVIEVQPSGAPPVRYNGRIWVRVGPSTQEAGAEDERVLHERARSRQQPFDHQPAYGATLDDLDLTYFEKEYLPAAVSAGVLRRNHRTLEEQMASLRFLVGGVPTYGALIVFGKQPEHFVAGAAVQFLQIEGTKFGGMIKSAKRFSGLLDQVVRQLDGILSFNITTSVDLLSHSVEQRVSDYPLAALQQLSRNAMIHRIYKTSNAPIRVHWFDDRVEIHSSGGLYGKVTKENFGAGVTDYRNPLIAEAMANMGYVQRFGYGIPAARQLLAENQNPPPEFYFDQVRASVTVRRRRHI